MQNKKWDLPENCKQCRDSFSAGSWRFDKQMEYDSDGDECGFTSFWVCGECNTKHKVEWHNYYG